MKRALTLVLCLAVGTPAVALDLAEFTATMSMGTPVSSVPPQTGFTLSTSGQGEGKPATVQTTRPTKGSLTLDSIWMIGVFR